MWTLKRASALFGLGCFRTLFAPFKSTLGLRNSNGTKIGAFMPSFWAIASARAADSLQHTAFPTNLYLVPSLLPSNWYVIGNDMNVAISLIVGRRYPADFPLILA